MLFNYSQRYNEIIVKSMTNINSMIIVILKTLFFKLKLSDFKYKLKRKKLKVTSVA